MNTIPIVFWLVPIASVIALAMAWYFFKSMMAADEGTPRMREIAEHVRKGAMAYLKQRGVEPVEALGAAFDTDYHEAVAKFPVEDPEKKNTVIDVTQEGYTLNGNVIRFAKVVVGI